jgi:hypothetical protein
MTKSYYFLKGDPAAGQEFEEHEQKEGKAGGSRDTESPPT